MYWKIWYIVLPWCYLLYFYLFFTLSLTLAFVYYIAELELGRMIITKHKKNNLKGLLRYDLQYSAFAYCETPNWYYWHLHLSAFYIFSSNSIYFPTVIMYLILAKTTSENKISIFLHQLLCWHMFYLKFCYALFHHFHQQLTFNFSSHWLLIVWWINVSFNSILKLVFLPSCCWMVNGRNWFYSTYCYTFVNSTCNRFQGYFIFAKDTFCRYRYCRHSLQWDATVTVTD